jgi:hypothetical protein
VTKRDGVGVVSPTSIKYSAPTAAPATQGAAPMSAFLDYVSGGETGYTGADAFGVSSVDAMEAVSQQPYAVGGAETPWWQSTIKYGLTRAIDNRLGPTQVNGNTAPGSYGGANGRSYNNGVQGSSLATATGLSPTVLLLIGAAVLALVLIKT